MPKGFRVSSSYAGHIVPSQLALHFAFLGTLISKHILPDVCTIKPYQAYHGEVLIFDIKQGVF